ncbi:MAG: dynamin family protein [Pseudomonadota bacterium]
MSLLQTHQQNKSNLLAHLRSLAGLADGLGMATLHADLRDVRIPKLEDERFNLVVLGEFNHGKTTFVNALLGCDLLPTGITPTTATINHVVWSDAPRADAILADGQRVAVAPDGLAEWLTIGGRRATDARYVEVGYPSSMLRNGVTLVDTPGVNDLNEQRAEITYGYVPRADAVIFLLDSTQALKESERAFIASRILERSRDRIVFVLGKMDLLSEIEAAEAITYVRQHLARVVGSEPPLFPVSARRQLAGEKSQSGMSPLLEHLERTLTTERGRILLDNAAADAFRTTVYLRKSLGVKKRALVMSLADLEERVEKVRAQLDATRESLGGLHNRIEAESEAVKAQIRLHLDQFASSFAEALPAQIDAANASDVKRYLPLFIQDKLKEWAEREGEILSGLLERLAEEVISVANENTKIATAALADRLGPADTAVDLDVDSFKYDVSVYAIGALGTTVFLFVNTLVGGLLTLAAPILAVVFQSKVAGEIKQQAKRQAPETIKRAATAIGPHFERIVSDFAKRLDEFVNSAGDKLYRGISEVLDRAIAERHEQGDEIGALAQGVDEQLASLTAIEGSLSELRDAIWASDGSNSNSNRGAGTASASDASATSAEISDAAPRATEASDQETHVPGTNTRSTG